MNYIPKSLIFSRILIGLIILFLSIEQAEHLKEITIGLIFVGLLTDIFDGIIARKLNISTPELRRLDSTIDQIFWILIFVAVYFQSPAFFQHNYIKLIVLFWTEGLCYLICFIKFKKEVATHAIASKAWTLLIFFTLIQIIATNNSDTLFLLCFYVGLITRLEIIAIIILLKEYTTDIPSVYHAVQLRKGKQIKRHKLFNG